MKNQLCFSLFVTAIFTGALTLSCAPDAKDKIKKSGGGDGGGETISAEDRYRSLQTSLVLEHLSLAKLSLETTGSKVAFTSKCRTVTPHLGENPFLDIDYFNCAINIPGSKSLGRFTGTETYSLEAGKIIISAPDLSLTIDGHEFTWDRGILINAKSIEALGSPDGVRFHLKETITPVEKTTLNKWSINILGRAQFLKAGTVGSFDSDLDATVIYVRPEWIPAKKKHEGVPARLKMKAQVDVAFKGSCSRPVSRFSWEATEGHGKGIIETSEQSVADPEKNDPVYQKPAPWPKCE
jgi:hypothetical protein